MNPKWRRSVQGLTLVLLVLVPVLNKRGWTFLTGSLYSFSIGPVWFTDPLIGLQTLLTAMTPDAALLLSVLLPAAAAFALGRVFCSWICPQNTLSELVDAAATRFGFRRPLTPAPKALPRYAVLAVVVVLIPLLGVPLASLLSAPGIISVQTAQLVTQGTIGLELSLVGIIILLEVFLVRRAWCNHLCPVGSFLGLLRTRRTLRVVFRPDAERPCEGCLACAHACSLGLDPRERGLYPQCHNCGDCVRACDGITGKQRPLRFEH
jgi:ferredoxin-type protein NapH